MELKKLLAKVEELYLIEQNKKIAVLGRMENAAVEREKVDFTSLSYSRKRY